VQAQAQSFTAANVGFSFDRGYLLNTGEVYSVFLSASAYNGPQGGGSSAWVDPYFAVDPSIPDAGQYAIDYGPGISAEAIPAPRGWTILLSGFACIGLAQRQGRRPAR
jgi:hypothetical protein